jgi:hypothetical protein
MDGNDETSSSCLPDAPVEGSDPRAALPIPRHAVDALSITRPSRTRRPGESTRSKWSQAGRQSLGQPPGFPDPFHSSGFAGELPLRGVERTGNEPVTSGLQSPIRPSGPDPDQSGDSRVEQGLSLAALRGLAGVTGAFRRPRAGCARDEVVAWLRNTTPTAIVPLAGSPVLG